MFANRPSKRFPSASYRTSLRAHGFLLRTVLRKARDYDALCNQFRWQVPAAFNIGVAVCDVWAARDPRRTAIIHVTPDERSEDISYGWLRENSNRLANTLRANGVGRGDRVAILLPQSPEVAAIHIAVYKLGAVALPLATLFGVDAISYRLKDAGAKAAITNAAGVAKLAELRGVLPELSAGIIQPTGRDEGTGEFSQIRLRVVSDAFTPRSNFSQTIPSMMIYTSGTTGQAKGALEAHRVLLGHLPGVEFVHEFFPQAGDRMWTPADWAWAGGLLNVLLPALYYGVPVVARKFEKFDAEEAFALMAKAGVRNAFIPPTALRMLRAAQSPRRRYAIDMRTIGSGGESLGAETYEWGKAALGMTINEFYGQTECNKILASCNAIGVSRAGAIGKPVPGHRVAVIRADGSLSAGGRSRGQIAVATA